MGSRVQIPPPAYGDEMKAMPKRKMRTVNVGELSKYEAVAVPCKVCGMGSIGKPVAVYARGYSASARMKIEKAGGKALLFQDAPEGIAVLRCLK